MVRPEDKSGLEGKLMKRDLRKILLGRPVIGEADLPKILLGRLAPGNKALGETDPHKILLGHPVVGEANERSINQAYGTMILHRWQAR